MPKVRVRLKTKSSPSQAASSADSELSKIKPDNIQGGDSSDKPSGPSKDTTSSAGTDSSEKSGTDSKKNSESDSTTDSTEKTESGSNTEPSAKPTPAPSQTPTIEKKVIFDSNNIVISSVDLKCPKNERMKLSVNIENKNDYTVEVTCISALLNNTLCVHAYDSTKVWAGKKATLNIELDKEYYSSYGIEPIGDFKLKFRVDNDDYDTLFTTDLVDIPTSLSDQMGTEAHVEGLIDLYSADGIDISGTFVDSFGSGKDCGVLMYVKNQTDRDISLDCYNAAANDTMLEYPWVYNGTVFAGTSAIVFLALSDYLLEKTGIDASEITKFEFSLQISDPSTYDRLSETDLITLVKNS